MTSRGATLAGVSTQLRLLGCGDSMHPNGCMHAQTHTHTHARTDTHAHTRTDTHTHAQTHISCSGRSVCAVCIVSWLVQRQSAMCANCICLGNGLGLELMEGCSVPAGCPRWSRTD